MHDGCSHWDAEGGGRGGGPNQAKVSQGVPHFRIDNNYYRYNQRVSLIAGSVAIIKGCWGRLPHQLPFTTLFLSFSFLFSFFFFSVSLSVFLSFLPSFLLSSSPGARITERNWRNQSKLNRVGAVLAFILSTNRTTPPLLTIPQKAWSR